ncbi:MAG: LuxR C-terminal-related transcriptional regulator [Bacteroidia bacterium]
MTKSIAIRQSPGYYEYHDFLKNSREIIKISDYREYIKQYSFFKTITEALPSAIAIYSYPTQQYLFVGKSCENILGYTAEEFMEQGRPLFLSSIYHEDRQVHTDRVFSLFLENAKSMPLSEIRKCRFSINFRMIRKDGSLVKILQQYTILEVNENNYPTLILCAITDITAHKPDNKMVFSISHYNKNTGFRTISSNTSIELEALLSPREKEIVQHIVYGHNTPQIADKLNISQYTVRAHRRNIFEKCNCKNIAGLVNFALVNGIA